jgi:hypothetical protein
MNPRRHQSRRECITRALATTRVTSLRTSACRLSGGVVRLFASCALAFAIEVSTVGAQDSGTTPAQHSVQTWLALIDTRSYAASWETAASSFKKVVPQETWSATIEEVRVQLGPLKARVPKSATPEKPPGAPQGEYIVFRFDTTFDRGPALIEVVAALKEKDGTWRVAGYLVK